MGFDVKYQCAFDVIDIDYPDLRLGSRLGMAL